ncbi:MAG TPA: hypothetical protein VIN77_12080 [Aurantimonas sp.]
MNFLLKFLDEQKVSKHGKWTAFVLACGAALAFLISGIGPIVVDFYNAEQTKVGTGEQTAVLKEIRDTNASLARKWEEVIRGLDKAKSATPPPASAPLEQLREPPLTKNPHSADRGANPENAPEVEASPNEIEAQTVARETEDVSRLERSAHISPRSAESDDQPSSLRSPADGATEKSPPRSLPPIPSVSEAVAAVDKPAMIPENEEPHPVETGGKVQSFSVFEGEEFDLCGFTEFSARLTGNSATPEVHLRSLDRSIPGRSFRGWEQIVGLREPAEIFEDCLVAADEEIAAGTRRVIISVFDKEG